MPLQIFGVDFRDYAKMMIKRIITTMVFIDKI